MGILGLSKLIADVAPGAIKECELKQFFGKFLQLSNLYAEFIDNKKFSFMAF